MKLSLPFAFAAAIAAAAPSLAVASEPTPAIHAKRSLTIDGAERVLVAARAEARKRNGGGVIAVVDDGGHLLCLERLDGTFAAGAEVSIGKARTSALFKKPTKFFEDVIAKGRTAMVTIDGFTPLQGGVPLTVEGEVVGAVGVSGAASAQADEEIAMAGAAALECLECEPAESAATVTHIDAARVAAAFAEGKPLLETPEYKIHASRRDKAGVAEVHRVDTDVIHVIDGRATLVTGGEVVEPKTVATDEVRGESIRGGVERRIEKGDVVVVPSNVPHWFKEVPGPLTYYVVKVPASTGAVR